MRVSRDHGTFCVLNLWRLQPPLFVLGFSHQLIWIDEYNLYHCNDPTSFDPGKIRRVAGSSSAPK